MGVTKNRQSFDTLAKITREAMDGAVLASAVELTDGLCNAAYCLTTQDGREAIIKIAPKDKHTMLTNEQGMMEAEVAAMRLVGEKTDLPVAKVYRHDTSLALCSSPYMIMERLTGVGYHRIKSTLTPQEIADINSTSGEMVRKVAAIKGERFGPLGDAEHQTDDLFSTVERMISNVLSDGARKAVPIGHPAQEILTALRRDMAAFSEVTTPALVHFDLWDGNILIKDKRISGIIDWERALYSEVLMEDRFRRHTRNDDFLRGVGKTAFTPSETTRILWYDVFLYLTMMIEGAYREYEDDSQYRWVQPLFEQSYQELMSQQA